MVRRGSTARVCVTGIGSTVVFALWEGGSAIEIDPDSLATRGPVEWRADLIAAPFSAHPLTDVDGSVWNFGSLSFFGSSGVLIWHIGADGTLRHSHILQSSTPGYLHAFAMTRRHLVFMLMPFEARTGDQAFFEQLRFLTNKPCRIALVPKDSLDAPRWFEVDFAAAYHFADAYESDNRVIMRVVRHRDAEEARSPMAAAMRGESPPPGLGTDLASLHLDLTTGRAHWESHGFEGVEFPAFDARTPGNQGALVFAPLRVEPAQAPYFNAIGRFDIERGSRDVYRYGATVLAEEHLFVPKRGGQRAGEGWLLGTWQDYTRNRGGVSLFDAEHVSHGPIASAWVPFTTPLGFHGWFAPKT
jgi:all-trans-8'-apo-beta-carotenal 15,15'-oxygenase